MVRDPNAVLADAAALAARRDVPEVGAFVAGLPPADDRSVVLLAAEEVDAKPLAQWFGAHDPAAHLEVGALDLTALDPGTTLRWNRAVGVLECGRLLDPDAVHAATALLARPAGSSVLVAVGAEMLTSADDLDLVRRGLWQVLFAEPGAAWSGQDLGEYGCLVWSERPAAQLVDPDVAALVARDVDRLARWAAGDPASAPLARRHAEHAVELLGRGLARPRAAVPDARPARDLRRQRDAVTTLRDRLLSRLDATADTVELQVSASLQACEQGMLAGIGPHLGRLRLGALSGAALRDEVAAYLRDELRTWHDDAVRLVDDRLRRDAAEADDLLDTVDWDVVNGAVDGGGYPRRLSDRLAPQPGEGVARPGPLSGPAAPTVGGLLTPALRSLAYGGVAAATSLAAIGPFWLPVTAVGAAVAAGGSLVDHRVSTTHARTGAERWAKAAISATVTDLARDVRQSLRAARDPVRRSVTAAFSELLTALSAAGHAPTAEPRPDDDGDHAAVATLRAALAQDGPPPVPGRST